MCIQCVGRFDGNTETDVTKNNCEKRRSGKFLDSSTGYTLLKNLYLLTSYTPTLQLYIQLDLIFYRTFLGPWSDKVK